MIAVETGLKIGCEYIEICPDTKRRATERNPEVLSHLADQYAELCMSCSQAGCTNYELLKKQELEK